MSSEGCVSYFIKYYLMISAGGIQKVSKIGTHPDFWDTLAAGNGSGSLFPKTEVSDRPNDKQTFSLLKSLLIKI